VLALRVPALLERCLALALQGLAAHRGSEHAALAPAPNFLAGEILHREIVGLAVGELNLEHLRRVVADVEGEAELVRIVLGSRNVECGDDQGCSFNGVLRCCDRLFRAGKGSGGEGD